MPGRVRYILMFFIPLLNNSVNAVVQSVHGIQLSTLYKQTRMLDPLTAVCQVCLLFQIAVDMITALHCPLV